MDQMYSKSHFMRNGKEFQSIQRHDQDVYGLAQHLMQVLTGHDSQSKSSFSAKNRNGPKFPKLTKVNIDKSDSESRNKCNSAASK